MDDLVEVQVVHASGDAHGPVHQQGRGDLAASPEHLIQLSLGTVLHDDAVAWSLSADAPEESRREGIGQILKAILKGHSVQLKAFLSKYRAKLATICYIQTQQTT